LSSINAVRNVREGGFVTDDGLTFLFVAGDSVDTYDSEDLYISTRSTTTVAFGTPVAYEHNNTTKNECCPTMALDLLMYERPAPTAGKHEIVSSILTGTTFSAPQVVALPGSDSFQQPTLSADGQRLVYVVNSGLEWHLEEAELDCTP
jgi:hypothetical protein